ncbi:MAG: hypothetical protein U1E30_09050 [Rhodoblastus sp.]
MPSKTINRRHASRILGPATMLAILLGVLPMTESSAQQAGWSRRMSQGVVTGPLPVPDPGSMASGTPLYMQQLGNNTPDPGDIAPENGQSFTIFNRRF